MKKYLVLVLAALMLLTIAGCGKKNGDNPADDPKYNLENPEPIPDGMEDSNGWVADGNYRNDVKLTCTLQSGYEVTLGMGDSNAGANAIYLNPFCSAPDGAAFYFTANRVMLRYSTDKGLATNTIDTFPSMETNSIAAFKSQGEIKGLDAVYHGIDNYGIAWQDSNLTDGSGDKNDTLTIKVCDKVTGEELGTVVAHIDYDAENDIYFLADMSEVIENADGAVDTTVPAT